MCIKSRQASDDLFGIEQKVVGCVNSCPWFALVFKLYKYLLPTALAATGRPRGAVIPAGEVDSSLVVTLPRPGGSRSLCGQLHLDIRPLEARPEDD